MFLQSNIKILLVFSAALVLLIMQSCSSSARAPKSAGFYDPPISSSTEAKANKEKKSNAGDKIIVADNNKNKNKSIFFINQDAQKEELTDYPSFIGTASWYGPGFHGKKTASGEVYNENALTVAHRTLPLGSKLKIINLENNKEVFARVNDRGPFIKGRILDGSKRVAEMLGYKKQGVARVKLIVLDDGKNNSPRLTNSGESVYTPDSKPILNPLAAVDENMYVVQLGAFKDKDNAYRFKSSLENDYNGLPFLINLSAQKYFRVLSGPFPSKKDADRIASEFSKKGIDNLVRFYGNI